MPDTCCCLYTIRLDATKFQPTKSQCKMLRKWGPGLTRSARVSLPGDSAASSTGREAGGSQEPIKSLLQGSLSASLQTSIQSGLLPPVSFAVGVAAVRGRCCSYAWMHHRCLINVCCLQVDQLPVPCISNVSDKQRKVLGRNVHFSSPVALALSSLLRNSAAGGRPSTGLTGVSHSSSSIDATLDAASIAQILSEAFNGPAGLVPQGEGTDRLSPSKPEAPQCLAYTAVPAAGHINFMFTGEASTSGSSSALGHDLGRAAAADAGPHPQQPPQKGNVPAAVGGTASTPCRHEQVEIKTVPAAYDQESFELYKRYQVGVASALVTHPFPPARFPFLSCMCDEVGRVLMLPCSLPPGGPAWGQPRRGDACVLRPLPRREPAGACGGGGGPGGTRVRLRFLPPAIPPGW